MNQAVSHELLDVVDENDIVVGVKTRGEIHAKGLMHRAVHILVFNSADDLFIQKRSMNKDENPGQWDSSSAGHVDSGETYLQCAIRELKEELGVDPKQALEHLFHVQPTLLNGFEHSAVYRCVHDGELKLQVEEIDEGAWYSNEQMDALVSDIDSNLTEILRLIWRRYRQLELSD
ncbi:MAG: NUDIX domain-containing protein [Gammaproteobacteria bacterium]|nr:NUDIX domain-containing protein [Gammaproteobacteria bacterium]